MCLRFDTVLKMFYTVNFVLKDQFFSPHLQVSHFGKQMKMLQAFKF